MSKSTSTTTNAKPAKPEKPYKDFPLFAHATKRWAKKIRGKLHYFGPWDDPQGALSKYQEQRDDLHAGRSPRVAADELTIADLANRFLTSKRNQMESGELTGRTWSDYYKHCELLIGFFGKNASVEGLCPADFDRYRAHLAKTRGPVAISKSIICTRVIFKWAFDNLHIDRPVRFGTVFKKPPKKVLRKAKRESGSRVYEAEELRKIIEGTKGPLAPMILLGINCGFGQSDIASLPLEALHLDNGFIDYPRPKTEVVRRCPLWPETVEALRDWLNVRPEAKDAADTQLVFLTHHGNRWIREWVHPKTNAHYFNDYIAAEYRKILHRLKITRRGEFYNLRHTFRTVADASKDQPAIDCIMGHTKGDMAEEYRDRIDDDRLQAVASVVHAWLFPAAKSKEGQGTEDQAEKSAPDEEPVVIPIRAHAG